MFTKLGIIGGSGPDAGVEFLNMCLRKNKQIIAERYTSDRCAPNIILFNNPKIGGPRKADDLANKDGEPYKLVMEAVHELVADIIATNCTHFVVACNTLHACEPEIRQITEMQVAKAGKKDGPEFVSMKRALLSHLHKSGCQKVAILGSVTTTSTIHSPYKDLFLCNKADQPSSELHAIELEMEAREKLQTDVIAAVKNLQPGESLQGPAAALEGVVTSAELTDADFFALACSEMSILLPYLDGESASRCVDPCQVLVDELFDVPSSHL